MKQVEIKHVFVARDSDGGLFAFDVKPFLVTTELCDGFWLAPRGMIYKIKGFLFDQLVWDDDPIETEVFSTYLVPLKK